MSIITREVESNLFYTILNEYREQNEKEMIKFSYLVNDFKETLEYGQKLINLRYDVLCKDSINKILQKSSLNVNNIPIEKESLINLLVNKENRYNIDSFLIKNYKKCLYAAQPRIEPIHKRLKNNLEAKKKKEKEIINKCFVTCFEADQIKKCLKKEMDIYIRDIVNDMQIYNNEVEKLGQNIYI